MSIFSSFMRGVLGGWMGIALGWSVGCFLAQRVMAEDAPSSVREVRKGVVAIGAVEVDALRKMMTFPAKVNLVEGNLEYALVNPNGPVHESLLVTETRAEDIEVGARLLGISRKRQAEEGKSGGGGNLTKDALQRAPKPVGAEISVRVAWTGADGVEVERSLLEALERKGREGMPFSREGDWIYTGSKVVGDGLFLASGSGILGSMLLASEPLFVGTFEGNRDDSVWSPARMVLPKVGTTVRVIIALKPKS
jgi:hypothetical protein